MGERGPKLSERAHTVIGRGGFGNQLFQAAWALALRSMGHSVRVDVGWYHQPTGGEPRSLEVDYAAVGISTVSLSRVQRSLICHLPKRLVYTDDESSYLPRPGARRKRFSTTYAQNARIPLSLTQDQIERLTRVEWGNIGKEDSVAVHVRLGDYRTHTATREHHGLTDPRWSLEQAARLREEYDWPLIRVFTDEPEWLPRGVLDCAHMKVSPSPPNSRTLLHEMCLSKALVMSNSSLSWWAGFLLSRVDPSHPVVFPEPWNRRVGPQDHLLALTEWHRAPRVVI